MSDVSASKLVDESSKDGGVGDEEEEKGLQQDEEEWQQETELVSQDDNAAQKKEEPKINVFTETFKNLKNMKLHELKIKVAPNETNKNILQVAQNAVVSSDILQGRVVHRESTRSLVEIGSQPITIEVALSQDLDRCVIVKVPEPLPERLFSIIRDSFATNIQLSSRPPDTMVGIEQEHEEPMDGPSVQQLLDAEYVAMVKTEMKQRAERDLTAFATPLERRARDDEKRVAKLEKLLWLKYNACRLPLPAAEAAPPLSSFSLTKTDTPAVLILRQNPSPREVDAQLKMAIRREIHSDSLARQERKKKEVLARAEACERNRMQLVSVLANSRAALEMDIQLMSKLGVNPPHVALCRVGCVYQKRPGFLVVTHQLIIFEPVGFFGYQLGSMTKLEAEQCRSVMKGRTNLGMVDSLCVTTDSQQGHIFYIPVIDEASEQLDQLFELLWQVLRMNRWSQ